jgi:hypothetical protein
MKLTALSGARNRRRFFCLPFWLATVRAEKPGGRLCQRKVALIREYSTCPDMKSHN